MSAKSAGIILLAMGLFLSLPAAVMAHPVTYKDGFAIMSWNQPFLNDVWGLYSIRHDMAIAARGMRMEMEDTTDTWAYFIQFDYLLKRWNEENFQANIYLYGGPGGTYSEKDHNGVAGIVGAEADAESRRWYVSTKGEALFAAAGRDVYLVNGRVGIAPYEANINDLATWFMVQVEYHPALRREFAVTPLLRLSYKNFLIEGGASYKGDWMANGMVHF